MVGINCYVEPAYAQLRFCVNDVLSLEQQLVDLEYIIVCMHDQFDLNRRHFPTRANIEAELRNIGANAAHDALILAHFVCHGVLRNGQRLLIIQDTRYRVLTTALSLQTV